MNYLPDHQNNFMTVLSTPRSKFCILAVPVEAVLTNSPGSSVTENRNKITSAVAHVAVKYCGI